MMNTSAEAFAPATVANLGVGFDILGLALTEPGDTVRVELREKPGAEILAIEGDSGKLPHDPLKNTACVAANSVLKQLGTHYGVGITLYKNLPLASGLGSSAASAVASAVAVNKLFGDPLTKSELLPACLDGEAAVSGRHADNVAPSLFGGITLIVNIDDIRILPIPPGLYLALVTPDVAVPTSVARSVLPKTIPLSQMVAQTAAVANLMDALYRQDIKVLAAAMESDSIIEPARAHLMPRLIEVRAVAKRAGALGLVISGAGPTLCAICDDAETAQAVSEAMHNAYSDAGIQSVARVTRIASDGASAKALDK
jgi:homoserine kinase